MARLRLLELYDDTYGIVNHDTDLSPFSLVSQVEQEDSLLLSGFSGYLDEYIKAGIKEFTDISFTIWMTYPYCKQKAILDVVSVHGTNKNNASNTSANALEIAILKQLKESGA